MSTIDAAIIKALVEHVGGDSSGIPDGTIGGKTYTAGDGIDITNDAISVRCQVMLLLRKMVYSIVVLVRLI